MKYFYGLIFLLTIFLTGCGFSKNPSIPHYYNIETFWSYCTTCIAGKCNNEEACKKNMSKERLKDEYILALTYNNIAAIKFFIDVLGFDVNEIEEPK